MKVYVESYGCTNNQSLGERLEGMLVARGFTIAPSIEEAEAIVVNTCTVKAQTERRMIRRIRELHELYLEKKLVIAGCLPTLQSELVFQAAPNSLTFGTHEYHLIPGAINGQLTQRAVMISNHQGERRFHRPGIGIVPISTGCLGACSYCIVRLIKGELRSYSKDEIVREVEDCRRGGAHEIWLTSQDLAAYGADYGNMELPNLLREILDAAGGMKVRLGMMNPSSMLPILDELLALYSDPRMYRFAHIPLQSGSNKVLQSMRREYGVDDWLCIIDRMRSSFPHFAISTDVIVGYPEETEKDFQKTLDLLKSVKPDIVNISRYEHRPGTWASRLKTLPGSEVKRRSRIASRLVRTITLGVNRQWLGWQGQALVSEVAPRGGFVARNQSYKPIIVDGSDLLGSTVTVKICGATENCLLGRREG